MNQKARMSLRLASVALLGLMATGLAQARGDNVYWSLGVQAAPGVAVGVSNARPVVVAPQPMYVQPAPVYVQPAPVYVRPAPVYAPPPAVYGYGAAPVYVQPAPVYYERPRWRHHPHGHAWGWRDRD